MDTSVDTSDAVSDASFFRKSVPRTDAIPQHTSDEDARELLASYISSKIPDAALHGDLHQQSEVTATVVTSNSTELDRLAGSSVSHRITTPTGVSSHPPPHQTPPQTPPRTPVQTTLLAQSEVSENIATVSTVLEKLRGQEMISKTKERIAPSSRLPRPKTGGFQTLVKAVTASEEPSATIERTSAAAPMEQVEIDARQRWLTELNKLSGEYNVKLSKSQWTMQDTSRAMQYEVRKAYQRLLSNKQKKVAINRIRTAGQIVKYANMLFGLNIPTLSQFDEKMNELVTDPVTLYKLDEMYNDTTTLQPEDPRMYLAKQILWPIVLGLVLKLAIGIFKPYVDIEELWQFASAKPASSGSADKKSSAHKSQPAYGSMVTQLLGSFMAKPQSPEPTGNTEPSDQNPVRNVFNLAKMLQKTRSS